MNDVYDDVIVTAIAQELKLHHRTVTREVVHCECSWYTLRGQNASDEWAEHAALAVARRLRKL